MRPGTRRNRLATTAQLITLLPSLIQGQDTNVLGNSLDAASSFHLVTTPIFARQKRQSGFSYVGTNGATTGSCIDAPTYSLINGQLYASQGGVTYQYSTTPGVAYTKFVPTTEPGLITTQFSFSSGTYLSWTNNLFFNGEAQWCSTVDGTVYAVFQENGQPTGCFYIALSLLSSADCQAAVTASATIPATSIINDKYIRSLAEE
ncbi:hypothetical protein AMS68_001593 [Peltaster fructicola]|uniref:DUF7908 domain-containing protein n=1 Tax=Peltaster fructicola TaxID=286661 RepID=A0A6H0XMZ5_9PEZI|nr:hypothetical protein AMS68_001593 [Peltaster fructicola]